MMGITLAVPRRQRKSGHVTPVNDETILSRHLQTIYGKGDRYAYRWL
ncbi:hypothetical protein [Nitrosovibrio sp. Nv6]|nr:hypothetical protein [Nitrosovibrio sp. Nv6]